MSMVLLVGGCDKQSAPSALRQQSISAESYNMSVVKTVGNYSYIPFNVDGNPSDHAVKILGALSAFEKAHPEIEITFWQIEKQQRAYITSSYIFGIWVTHRPKK
ncbi:MAG: hypothetical protein HYT20_01555 [Candidatus Nealsonbacteria bacterium]|nr:hypothetical protein [Candidatus Nealsonbacteria bacterium]